MTRLLLSLVLVLAATGLAGAQDAKPANPRQAVATFAGGCFWCLESDFDPIPGVISTVSGYIGGTVENPTYQQVSAGGTGHAEAVEITYDPTRVTYDQLLTHFWRNVDPTQKDGQFCDIGDQYRTAIFVHNDEQRKLAGASKKKIAAELGKPVYTEIAKAGTFYKAEDYHQDFYKKSELRYKFYRWNCGRDQRLKQLWGKAKGES
jgi:peptide-methionine (S)-S-oxide reductase